MCLATHVIMTHVHSIKQLLVDASWPKLTQHSQPTMGIAKIGVWHMHLSQIKGQEEAAGTVCPVPHQATDVPYNGAQQVI